MSFLEETNLTICCVCESGSLANEMNTCKMCKKVCCCFEACASCGKYVCPNCFYQCPGMDGLGCSTYWCDQCHPTCLCEKVSLCSEHHQGQVCHNHILPPGYFIRGCKK